MVVCVHHSRSPIARIYVYDHLFYPINPLAMFEDRKTSNIDLDIAFLAAFHIGIRTHRNRARTRAQRLINLLFLLCRPYLSDVMDEWSFRFFEQEKTSLGTMKIRCRDWNHPNVICNSMRISTVHSSRPPPVRLYRSLQVYSRDFYDGHNGTATTRIQCVFLQWPEGLFEL